MHGFNILFKHRKVTDLLDTFNEMMETQPDFVFSQVVKLEQMSRFNLYGAGLQRKKTKKFSLSKLKNKG